MREADDDDASGVGDELDRRLGELGDAGRLEDGLRAVAALGKLLEQLEALQVRNAREAEWSWQEIAEELGVSRQAVHKKYARGRLLSRRR